MHTHVSFIFSLVFLSFNTTTATSFGHQQLVAAAGGVVNKCIDKERQGLLDFKAPLHDQRGQLSTWRPEEEDDCCQWRGITCNNQTGHVTKLDLSRYFLEGEITHSLLTLSYLSHLDLSFNSFHGTIPQFIGNMTRLTYLDLYYNYFTGSITKFISNITRLTDLNLSGNQFTGSITKFMSNMTRLTYLDLSLNQFTGSIPKSIGHMTQLTFLDLHENQLIGNIPDTIGSLAKLRELSLWDNNLSGAIPMSIGSSTNLTTLYLSDNNFSGTIPMSIGSLTELTQLDLSGNNFIGSIPRSIGSMTKLNYLGLSDNSFTGTIPHEFGNLTNLAFLSLSSLYSCTVENLDWLSSLSYLEYLHMDGISLAKANNWVNVIIGLQNLWELSLVGCNLSQVMHPYSSSVNSSLSLEYLYVNNNNLNSSMYRWLCPLIGNKLESLIISRNKFDGKLSEFLNMLSGCTSSTTLYTLDASSSQFTGSLSDEIQHFSSLYQLNLSYNQLDGTISDKLWQLPSLQRLYLSSNSLRGAISENIGKSNLGYIDLSNNSLEGAFFNDDMTNFSWGIQYIDFSSNKLGPRFPKCIQKLKNLTYLDLSRNNIADTVSAEYWNQWQSSQLSYLDLSFNNISGKLPKSLSNHHFDIIILSVNNFYGPIPAFPASISFLDLSRNKFHGGISFLCQMYQNLEVLDLSRNTITGQLPDCFRNLTYLKVLNLGHNTLSGKIPSSIGYLGQLETLCLYNNSFSGGLPLSLKNCRNLSLLDLGANNLYGNIPVWIGEKLSRLYALSLNSNNLFGAIPSQICQLASLQILDLSYNNLNGTIPSCLNNLTSMVQKGVFVEQNVHHYYSYVNVSFNSLKSSEGVVDSYLNHLLIKWQGRVSEFSSTMGLVKTIDFSSNNLIGQIPFEITDLHELLVLDLSNNTLVGEIPRDIGQMIELLTLNLSRNMLSGEIPSTMSQMDLLNDLDVSYNNLSGRVPSGTQLQSFPPERFAGNIGLCGLPTAKKCLEDEDKGVPPVGDSEGDADEFQKWFYIGGATGFATAFWITCSALLLNRRLRHAFFHFHNCLKDWVYVKVVVFIARLQRVARG